MDIRKELLFVDLTARMALRADASMFLLGYVWWVLEPLLFVAVFYLVFGVILDSPRGDLLSFLVLGKLPFQWFSGSLNSSSTSITQASALIAQTPIPKALLVLSRIQQSTYKQVAVFVLLGVYLAVTGESITVNWLWVPAIAAVQYLLIVAASLLGAVLVCVARDFSKLIQLFTIAMMFGSGIFWDVRALDHETQWWVMTLNPLAYLLDAYRQVLLYDGVFDVSKLLLFGGFFAGLSALIMTWIRRHETWLALRVLS